MADAPAAPVWLQDEPEIRALYRFLGGSEDGNVVPMPEGPVFDGCWFSSHATNSRVIDGTLFTLSERGLLASDLDTLEPGAWVSLGG